ncbi:hypothetical protein ACFYV7_12915 [Nocardia suismassiliense]|uniref:Uncharacterized protein n=1 Tax=Nocardia suismassiliense TaxID=2077092 RepID=A0ABW6QR62_9NOCA
MTPTTSAPRTPGHRATPDAGTRSATTPTHNTDRTGANNTGDSSVFAVLALAIGVGMLIAAFVTLDRVPGWADDYGAILVYLAFFLYMSIAGRLTWWAIDTLLAKAKNVRGSGRR